MNLIQKILTFVVLPLAIAGLIFFNSELATRFYSPKVNTEVQYSAAINSSISQLSMVPSEGKSLIFNVKNEGKTIWIPNEESDIVLSYRILNTGRDTIVMEGDRVKLPHAVRPGDEVKLNMTIIAPEEPGQYIIVIDMVHEGVTWFADKGSKPWDIQLEVVAK